MTETIRLRDVGSTYGGLTGKSKADFGRGAASFVTFLEVINSTRLRGRALERVRVAKGERQSRVMRGDLLFNGSSETPEEVALSAVVDFDPEASTFLNSFCFGFRLRPDAAVEPTYLAYFFRSSAGRSLVASLAQGATRYNIAKTKFLDVELALPSVGRQREIAESLSDVDDHIAALERMIAKKQAIKQGMMQQLLTGRTRLPNFRNDWREASLNDVATVDAETLSASTDPKTMIDYVSLDDVDRGQLLGYKRVSFGSAPSRARRVLREMDVLFGTVRPNLQSHALYRGGLKRPIASTGFAVVRAADGRSDPCFLFYLLMGHSTMVQIHRIVAGSNYPAVSGGDVRRLTFSLPALDEQRKIGSILADADESLLTLERRVAKARWVKQGMMQELLTGQTRLPTSEAAA